MIRKASYPYIRLKYTYHNDETGYSEPVKHVDLTNLGRSEDLAKQILLEAILKDPMLVLNNPSTYTAAESCRFVIHEARMPGELRKELHQAVADKVKPPETEQEDKTVKYTASLSQEDVESLRSMITYLTDRSEEKDCLECVEEYFGENGIDYPEGEWGSMSDVPEEALKKFLSENSHVFLDANRMSRFLHNNLKEV